MSVGTPFVYLNFRKNLGIKLENLSTDTLKAAYFTSSYTPNGNTDCAYAVAVPSLASGNITRGGASGPGAQTVYYWITYVNGAGETTVSNGSGATGIASTTTTGQVSTIASPAASGGSVTGYNVYASTTNASTGSVKQNASPVAIGTNWTEPNSGITGSGLGPPSSNTAQISGEMAAGNGYSTGGLTLASVAWAEIQANSWPDVWTASTGYALGQIVRPAVANGFVYLCVGAGTSGSSAPSWGTTIPGLTTDSSVTWLCLNSSLVALTASNLSWAVTAALTYRYIVIYDSTTNDLILYFDPGANQTGPNSGNIQANWDAGGLLVA